MTIGVRTRAEPRRPTLPPQTRRQLSEVILDLQSTRQRATPCEAVLALGSFQLGVTPLSSDRSDRRFQLPEQAHSSYAPARRKRWSQFVTRRSDALDLDRGVFARSDPRAIARSLKRSADRSHRRKSAPFRSAISMLTFYINRAGKQLSRERRKTLLQAKDELRDLYGRPRQSRRSPLT